MRCPTCSSPLPDGAMFCGQCGRAITSADVAAYAAQQEADQAREAAVLPEVPAWSLREPEAPATPPGTPWWVAERGESGEADDDGIDDPVSVESVASAVEPEPVVVDSRDSDDSGDSTNDSSVSGDSSNDGEADDAGRDSHSHIHSHIGEAEAADPLEDDEPTREPDAPTPTPADVDATSDTSDDPDVLEVGDAPPPLRPPGPVLPGGSVPGSAPTSSGRPTSAPLWTASLTPITPEMQAEARAAETSRPEQEPTGQAPDDADDTRAPAAGENRDRAAAAPAPSSTAPENEPVAHTTSAGGDAPRPGDTNVIAALVAPSSRQPDGRQRCTVCGAVLADDDIFCGECGTVVQSVAQSFTGPITPILTHPVAPEAPPEGTAGDVVAHEPEGASGPQGITGAASDTAADAASSAASLASEPRPAPLAPTPVQPTAASLPPFVPDPEPEPRRRRLFGRRPTRESPKLWSEGAHGAGAPARSPGDEATMPPVQAAPAAAPASTEPAEPEKTVEPPVGLGDVPAVADQAEADPAPAPLRATPVDAPPQTAPVVMSPVPPAPESPRRAAPWAVGSLADDVEQTRIVARRPLGEPFTLQFSTGESFTVQGTGLVGRAPAPQPGDSIDLLVRIIDPGKSVSKTHLEFGQDDGHLWISDRWSGNGTVLRPPASVAKRCEPGKRVRVPRGSRVEIGEQFFTVN